jgi:hypothetical protein
MRSLRPQNLICQFVRLCKTNPLYTTFDVRLDFAYPAESDDSLDVQLPRDRTARMIAVINQINAEEDSLHLLQSQTTELVALLHDMRTSFKTAAQTIPLRLLGQFVFCDTYEAICGEIQFDDLEHTRLVTSFTYRSDTLVTEHDAL